MKKIIIILLAVVSFASHIAFANNITTLTINEETENENYIVSVDISDNAGIAGFNIAIEYDNTQLIPVSIENGMVLENYSIVSNMQQNVDLAKLNKVTACVFSPGNIKGDGHLYSVHFKLLDKDTDAEVKLTYDNDSIVNEELENVAVRVVNNTVKTTTPAPTEKPLAEPTVAPTKKPNKGGGGGSSSVTVSSSPTEKPTQTPVPSPTPLLTEQPNETEEIILKSFVDVNENDWFYDSVMWGYQKSLINGVSENEFAPYTEVSRAMLVTMLYRYSGNDAKYSDTAFTDINEDSWYYDAVVWAYNNGIVNGMGNNMFAPDQTVTREQIAKILYLFAKTNGRDINVTMESMKYSDVGDISDWAYQEMLWAVDKRYINGRSDTELVPGGAANRAEVITILKRFLEN